ncbi:MAG: PhzF family phenazine biosynthesis protein [Solirubrobacteraceae bacterium]
MRHPYTLLDVFTDRPLAGNGLAVVHEADGVDDGVMLAFARETRLMETTFVQTPTAPGADYRNRIWTIGEEVPFAGHPSLGTAVAVALARGEEEVVYRQQTQAGVQPVTVSRSGDRARASVLQEPAVAGAELDPAAVMAAAGLRPDDAHPSLAPQIVSTGLPALIAPVADAGALARARPVHDAIGALEERSFNYYLCWVDPDAGTARARSFARFQAEGEDPATGSAAGPLMAYVHERLGLDRLEVAQGVEMGRPSRLLASMEDGRARVGGDVVVLVTGVLRLPKGDSPL